MGLCAIAHSQLLAVSIKDDTSQTKINERQKNEQN